MTDFLERKPPESHASRYIQMNLFSEEYDPEPPPEVRSSKDDTPDSLIQYDSAGGKHSEFETTTEKEWYNKVRVLGETHEGHLLMFDSTPEYNRIYTVHPNGSYTDVITIPGKSGRKVKTEGDEWFWVSKNWFVEIKIDEVAFIHRDRKTTIDRDKISKHGRDELTTNGRNWYVTSGTHQKHIAPRIDFNP